MRKILYIVLCVLYAYTGFISTCTAAESGDIKGKSFFTRANLKVKGKTVFFHNMAQEKNIIPVGTEVVVAGSGKRSIRFNIPEKGEKTYRLTDSETVYDKYFVTNKDEIGLNKMSEKLLKAVKSMKIYEGMTKNEVLVSKGYPAYISIGDKSWGKTREQVLASDSWYYNMDTRRREMIVSFKDGKVSQIETR